MAYNKAIKHAQQAVLDSQQIARRLWRRYVENSDGAVTAGGTTTMSGFTIIDYLKINLIPGNPCLANSFLPPYPARDNLN